MIDSNAFIKVLAAEKVDFIVVGGVAASMHGSAQVTYDLDIVYSRSDANIERLVRALEKHQPYLRGAPPGLPFQWSADTIKRGLNFTLTTRLGAIDLLGEITGGGEYEDLLPEAEQFTVGDHEVLCLSLEQLIHTKRAAGRPRDFNAIAELEALREERDAAGTTGAPQQP